MSVAGRPPRGRPGGASDAPRGSEPYGAIIERYRGTKWDATPDLPEPPRNPLSGVLIAIGVVVLLIIGAYAFISVVGRPPGRAAGDSRFIATAQPTAGPDELLLSAFWSEIGRPAFGYRETITAAVAEGSSSIDESVALEVRADDFSGTADIDGLGIAQPAHLILLRSGGVLYLKTKAGDAWQGGITAGQIELHTRPFLGLEDPRQLIVSGTGTFEGVTYQRLVSTALYRAPLKQLLPIALGDLPPATTTLELLVTGDGRPVTATFTIHAPADPANGAVAIDGHATYVFTEVDHIDPIPAPSL